MSKCPAESRYDLQCLLLAVKSLFHILVRFAAMISKPLVNRRNIFTSRDTGRFYSVGEMASNVSNFSPAQCLFLDTNLQPLKYISIVNIAACVLNAFFALVASLTNAVITFSIWKTPSLHTPANLLLGCVAFSDFLVGAIVQPLDVAQRILEERQNFKIYCSLRLAKNSLAWIISSVSFCILTAIAVERFVAIVNPLRHNALVSKTLVQGFVVFSWAFCSSFILGRFLGLKNNTFFAIALFFIFINVIINAVSYFKTFQAIKQQQKQIHYASNLSARLHPDQMTPTDIRRFKTFTLTVVYVLVLIFLFYIPFICYLVAYTVLGFTGPVKLAYVCMETLLYVDSSINPFVFSYRLHSIRQAVHKTIGTTFSLKRNTINVT